MNTSRIIQGEDEETDIIYTSSPNQFYDVYEDDVEEYEEDVEADEIPVYEMYDEEIDLATSQHIQNEADLLCFGVEDPVQPSLPQSQQIPKTTTTQQSKPTSEKSSKPIPSTTRKLRAHLDSLPRWTSPHPDVPRPLTVSVGASIRNIRTSAVAATTQSRLSKEHLATLNQSFAQSSLELETTIQSATWLDHFIIFPVK